MKYIFRGKRKDNGEWVEGKGIDVNYSDAYIFVENHDLTTGCCDINDFEVMPETVGMYTNIDLHGVKVFEGDIVRLFRKNFDDDAPYTAYYQVIFDKRFRYWTLATAAGTISCYNLAIFENDLDCEVVGNVWDNPELLKANN